MNTPQESIAAAPSVQSAVDWLRFSAIAEMADLAASYWRSVAEAAYREEGATIHFHCRQIAAVTREAFALAKQIGSISNRGDAS